jgi:hypothetical protein
LRKSEINNIVTTSSSNRTENEQQAPLPKFSRLVIFVYLFAAPALLMAADTLHYYHHYLIANVIFKAALTVFIVGSFGLAYLFKKPSRYFGLIGTGMVALGAVTISAMSTETLLLDLVNHNHFNADQVKAFKNILRSTEAVRVIYLPSGFAFPLGLIVLAIGVFRSPYAPRYVSLILCTGAVFHTIARFTSNLSLLLLSELVLLIASALTGWFMWRYKPDRPKH